MIRRRAVTGTNTPVLSLDAFAGGWKNIWPRWPLIDPLDIHSRIPAEVGRLLKSPGNGRSNMKFFRVTLIYIGKKVAGSIPCPSCSSSSPPWTMSKAKRSNLGEGEMCGREKEGGRVKICNNFAENLGRSLENRGDPLDSWRLSWN